ncbi:hypothetical protein ACFSJM_08730 [Lactococcus formosensis subsp. bovis]|uniref:hypothetical protein n=1 Tax=Lactococcus formosensis TaxID=1281486 RepID=UPI001BCD0040|nr:hypothetical protein [Lactococcus formosensis]
MGKTKIISLLVVIVVIIGGFGGYMFSHQKSQTESFTATENVMDKLKKDKSSKAIIVFYSEGSDYSKVGAGDVLKEAKQVNFPVYYINFDSPEKIEILKMLEDNDITSSHGLTSDEISKVNTATMVSIDNREYMNRKVTMNQYADQLNGKYVPLTDNIKQCFDLLK